MSTALKTLKKTCMVILVIKKALGVKFTIVIKEIQAILPLSFLSATSYKQEGIKDASTDAAP